MPDPGAQRADREVDVDVDIGVDPGQDDTLGEDDQGNGDQVNGGDANVQASDASGDTTVGGRTDQEGTGIEYDFTPNKAVDKDEDSLIAYDQYKGDPVYKSGDPSRSVTVGARQAYKDQEDVVGAYVMAVASQSGPARAERGKNIGAPGTGYRESVQSYDRQMREGWDAYDKRQDQIVDYESPSLVDEAGMTEEISTWGKTEDSALRGMSLKDPRMTRDISHALSMTNLDQLTRENAEAKSLADKTMLDARVMAAEKSDRAFFQERTRLAALEKQQKALADTQKIAVTEKKISTAIVANDQMKAILAIDKLLENPQLTEEEKAAKRKSNI